MVFNEDKSSEIKSELRARTRGLGVSPVKAKLSVFPKFFRHLLNEAYPTATNP